MAYGRDLFRTLSATARSRDTKRLRECVLRMDDCSAPNPSNQCTKADCRRSKYLLQEDNPTLSQPIRSPQRRK